MAEEMLGFIGLGNMGGGMARNVRAKGHALIVHDRAGTADRAPDGAEIAQSNAEVARRSSVVALSLPSLAANRAVVEELAEAGHAGRVVIDTCTIGPEAAAENARILAAAGIAYVDAPVSGLKFRADEGTLASMVAGPKEAVERARPLIESYSRSFFHVGEEPGQGQRMKLVNNAIYLSSLITISESLAYGENGGLDPALMLEVVNASSGQSMASEQVFPNYMIGDDPANSGADAHIIAKDLSLFVASADAEAMPNAAVKAAYKLVQAFSDEDPSQDKGAIYRFVRDRL